MRRKQSKFWIKWILKILYFVGLSHDIIHLHNTHQSILHIPFLSQNECRCSKRNKKCWILRYIYQVNFLFTSCFLFQNTFKRTWSLITNFRVWAKSEFESAIDCPWQTRHLKFLLHNLLQKSRYRVFKDGISVSSNKIPVMFETDRSK